MDEINNQVSLYLNGIRKWNRKINLVSENDLPQLYDRHYLDSIAVLTLIPEKAVLLDMGSGNGFPSIPIAIHRPDVTVVAVEIKQKKALFLENIRKELKLQNFSVLNISLDNPPSSLESSADVITSRAFKDLPVAIKKAYYFARNKAHLLYYNSLSYKDMSNSSQENDKVIHNVNNVVYKSAEGKMRSIIDITINKHL